MGASIGMAKGAADAGHWPAIAIIGDSTFTHSGMTGLLDAINENANITVIISDNLTTAMTGGQDSAGTQCVYSDELLQNQGEKIDRGNGTLVHITAIFGFTLAGLIVQDAVQKTL